METREAYRSLHNELKALATKVDQANEQITIIRIEMAEHRVKIGDSRKLHSSLWGILGGAVTTAIVAVVDFVFRK